VGVDLQELHPTQDRYLQQNSFTVAEHADRQCDLPRKDLLLGNCLLMNNMPDNELFRTPDGDAVKLCFVGTFKIFIFAVGMPPPSTIIASTH
jgi:hypothetical protein